MIQEGLRTQQLRPGKTILDSTSGNTGIALALIGSVIGSKLNNRLPEAAMRRAVLLLVVAVSLVTLFA